MVLGNQSLNLTSFVVCCKLNIFDLSGESSDLLLSQRRSIEPDKGSSTRNPPPSSIAQVATITKLQFNPPLNIDSRKVLIQQVLIQQLRYQEASNLNY